jgi:hypothetical protein
MSNSRFSSAIKRILDSENTQQSALPPRNPNETKILKLECRIRKLELKLRLVDKEYIDNKEFDNLIKFIQYFCGVNDETKGFIREMMLKNAENKKKIFDYEYKRVVNILNIVLPCLSIFISTAIPFLIIKNITTADIDEAIFIYNKINNSIVLPLIQGSVITIDLYSKALEIFDAPINKSVKHVLTVTKNIGALIPRILQIVIKTVKDIFVQNKNKKLKKKLGFSYLSLFLAIFIFSLYIQQGGIDNQSELINLIHEIRETESFDGGKKVKKPKKKLLRKNKR